MRICTTRTVTLLSFAALLAVLGAARVQAAEGAFDRTLKVSGPTDLTVTTGSGNIEVRKGEPGSVRIHGEIRVHEGWHMNEGDAERKVKALESNPPIEQTGNIIRVGHIDDPDLRKNVSISYEIAVPEDTQLKSQTGSGNQTVEGIRGPARVGSGSGTLKVSDIGDELRAETGSGELEIQSVRGNAFLKSGSGSIRAEDIGGSISAETGSGNLRLSQSAPGPVKVNTGSGSAQITHVRGSLRAETGSGGISAEGEPTGEWILHAGSGDLTVRIPSSSGFDLNARSGSGQISTSGDHPVTIAGTVSRHELHGKVHGGGVRMDLETGSGNIRIE
jgi:putative adhesin